MSTLHHLNMALLDMQERVQRELQFSADAEKLILDNMATAMEALGNLDRSIRTAFGERNRALSLMLGSGKPSPETVQHVDVIEEIAPIRKPKAVASAADAAP